MPRSNREYLLRYADQAINDIERSLERMKMLSDAYGGIYKPMDGDVMPVMTDEPSQYEGAHGKYQQYVDVNAELLMTALENMKIFRTNYM